MWKNLLLSKFSTTLTINMKIMCMNPFQDPAKIWPSWRGIVLSPTRKETSYRYKTRNLLNILPTKLNTLLSSLFYLLLATQKKFRKLSVQPGHRRNNYLRIGRKIANFNCFFQSRKQVIVRRGQIRRIGWVIKTLEAQIGHFLLGCKCPVSRGIVAQGQDHLGELPRRFSFKISFNYTSRDE